MRLFCTTGVRLSIVACASVALAVPLVLAAPPAGAEAVTISPTATALNLGLRGNGHGHGMSQYGARGAAIQGVTYANILKFYYPGTTLVTGSATHMRVKLGNTGSALTVAADPALTLTSMGTLPSAGISKYRLVLGTNSTVTLQKFTTSWVTVKTGLASGVQFAVPGSTVRVFTSSGSRRYYDAVKAIPQSTGVMAINYVIMDYYVRAVVPREMPASWNAAAVSAQAVAARTYGRYAIVHPANAYYDICDSSACQMYGGQSAYDTAGNLLWTDDPAAITGNANQILLYNGQPIFAQFSASNGGWTVAGGQPYLVAKVDPYDNTASTDPYLSYTDAVPLAQLRSYFGLKTLTYITVTQRDGNGTWGGRVLAGYVKGTDTTGAAKQVSFTGYNLQAAVGAGTTWIYLQSAS